MGYRSEVSITMEQKDFDRLVEEVKGAGENVKEVFNWAKKIKCGEFATISWDWIQWYEEYEEIDFFESFYRKLDHYKFIRIGEDDNDVEQYYEGDWIDCAELVRKISCVGDEFECEVTL